MYKKRGNISEEGITHPDNLHVHDGCVHTVCTSDTIRKSRVCSKKLSETP